MPKDQQSTCPFHFRKLLAGCLNALIDGYSLFQNPVTRHLFTVTFATSGIRRLNDLWLPGILPGPIDIGPIKLQKAFIVRTFHRFFITKTPVFFPILAFPLKSEAIATMQVRDFDTAFYFLPARLQMFHFRLGIHRAVFSFPIVRGHHYGCPIILKFERCSPACFSGQGENAQFYFVGSIRHLNGENPRTGSFPPSHLGRERVDLDGFQEAREKQKRSKLPTFRDISQKVQAEGTSASLMISTSC